MANRLLKGVLIPLTREFKHDLQMGTSTLSFWVTYLEVLDHLSYPAEYLDCHLVVYVVRSPVPRHLGHKDGKLTVVRVVPLRYGNSGAFDLMRTVNRLRCTPFNSSADVNECYK
jgi:hypothetical protein